MNLNLRLTRARCGTRRLKTGGAGEYWVLAIAITINKVTFDNCLLDQVIEVLDGQYAIGSVEVIIINPVPEV